MKRIILINFKGEAGLKAEENSKKIIEAYHFLVSINPETIKQNLPEYTKQSVHQRLPIINL
jgi:hypothetical protein